MEGIIVQTTTSTQEAAKALAHSLISKKFASCVTIIPNCISVYSWDEKIQEENEFELQIKSFKSYKNRIFTDIKKNSSYEVPQLIVTQIVDMSESYFSWMKEQLGSEN